MNAPQISANNKQNNIPGTYGLSICPFKWTTSSTSAVSFKQSPMVTKNSAGNSVLSTGKNVIRILWSASSLFSQSLIFFRQYWIKYIIVYTMAKKSKINSGTKTTSHDEESNLIFVIISTKNTVWSINVTSNRMICCVIAKHLDAIFQQTTPQAKVLYR